MRQIRAMGFLAILVGFGLALGSPCALAGEQLDLNRATLAEIEGLPLTEAQARAIWEYREYRAYFSSVYELLDLPEERYEYQVAELTDWARMLVESGANGAAPWWFPGGLRVNEGSDWGLFHPDGTPRPCAREPALAAAAGRV